MATDRDAELSGHGSRTEANESIQGKGGPTPPVTRVDVAMVRRGLAPTRSKAQRMIRARRVYLEGKLAERAAIRVHPHEHVSVQGSPDDYVSRGAYKLIGAFQRFSPLGLPTPRGLLCLDIGASTGGFSQVLLDQGAAKVIALDVGHGQLNPIVANNPRTIEMSGTNIRDVQSEDLPFRPELVVSDVSFISLSLVIPVIARIATPGAHVVLLVKPQFEVGRGRLNRHGIVEDPQLRKWSLAKVTASLAESDMAVHGEAPSPIEGTHDNQEYLLYARTGIR